MAGKEFIQEFWNFKSGQLGFNSHDETAHQKVGSSAEPYFPPGGLGELGLSSKASGQMKPYENVWYFPHKHWGVREHRARSRNVLWAAACHLGPCQPPSGGEMCGSDRLFFKGRTTGMPGSRAPLLGRLAGFRQQEGLSRPYAISSSVLTPLSSR